MPLETGVFEAMYTLRAMRRLRPDPVPDEALARVLEASAQAASGANLQPWRFLLIRDSEIKKKIAEYYLDAWDHAYGDAAVESAQDPAWQRVLRSARHLAHHFAEVPVLVLVCMLGRPPKDPAAAAGRYGSIYPAVQNLMLAARGLGLGTTLTTLHKRHDQKVKELLDIPEDVETICLIPMGYPQGRFGPLHRQPVTDMTFYDRWGAPSSRD
jgi:nitroreductase